MAKVSKRTRKFKTKEHSRAKRRLAPSHSAKTKPFARGSRQQTSKNNKDAHNEKEEDASDAEDSGFANVKELGIDELLKGDFLSEERQEEPEAQEEDQRSAEEVDDEIDEHMQELEALKEADPEFYAHLMKNERSLLKFGTDEPEETAMTGQEAHDNGDDDDDDNEGQREEPNPESLQAGRITQAVFDALKDQALNKRGLRSLKRLVRIFRAACHANDDAVEGECERDLVIADASVFSDIMRVGLREIPLLIEEHLGGSSSDDARQRPGWKRLESCLRSFLLNSIHFLSACVAPSLARLCIARLSPLLSHLRHFPRLCTRMRLCLLHHWSASTSSDALRIDAFVQLRELCLLLASRPAFLDASLKGIYLAFVRSVKNPNAAALPLLRFQLNCVGELYSIDANASYRHAFVYLRQLAILLRQKRTDSSELVTIYNAQVLFSMRVWARVIAASASDSPLRALVYPFVEIASGIIALSPSCRFVSLHLALLRMLHEVSASSGAYVPLSSALLEIMQRPMFASKPRPSTAAQPSLDTIFRASKTMTLTKPFQEQVMSATVRLLREHLALWSHEFAFPELAFMVRRRLAAFCKRTPVHRFRKLVQTLDKQTKTSAVWLVRRRSASDLAPNAIDKLLPQDEVSPLQRYVALQGEQLVQEDAPQDERQQRKSETRTPPMHQEQQQQQQHETHEGDENDEDVVEDFDLSELDSDEEMQRHDEDSDQQ